MLFCQKPFVFCLKLSITCYFLSRAVRRRRHSRWTNRQKISFPEPPLFLLSNGDSCVQRRFRRNLPGYFHVNCCQHAPPQCAANAAKPHALGVNTLQIVIVCILPPTNKTMRHNPRSRNIIRKNKTGEKSKSKLPLPPVLILPGARNGPAFDEIIMQQAAKWSEKVG